MADKPKARSKQTDATLTAICEALRLGVPSSRASKAAGISYQTFCSWRNAGWEAIEAADEDSDAPLTFVARFAVEVEASLVAFMQPFLKRIRAEAEGAGKGDWRACRAILEMRFPDEFSEKVRAAQTAKLEVSGSITHEMQLVYSEHMQIKNMTTEELAFHAADVQSRLDSRSIEGKELDAEIAVAESKLGAMTMARDRGYGYVPCNWNVVRPAMMPTGPKVIDLDEYEVSTDLAADIPESAPIAAGAEVILSSASATPSPPRRSGIAYDANGLAFHPPVEDEDLSL